MHFKKSFCLFGLLAQTAALTSLQGAKTDDNFNVLADFNRVCPSKVDRPHSRKQDQLSFNESRLRASYTQRLSEKSGLVYGIGASNTRFGWDRHPEIRQKNFNNLLVDFGGYKQTERRWVWDANIGLQINTDHFAISRYTLFQGYLHAKYEWRKTTNIHVGAIAITGMRYSRMLPVIGFDHRISDRWKLNAIFPTNFSIIYEATNRLSLNIASHFFLSRQRLGSHEHHRLKRGLIAWHNVGVELGADYQVAKSLFANVHVGETFGGRLRFSGRNDKNRHHYRYKAAPYFGCFATLSF